jgi:hypothetical protein
MLFDRLSEHLMHCHACEATLSRFSHAYPAHGPARFLLEPNFKRLVTKVMALRPDCSQSSAQALPAANRPDEKSFGRFVIKGILGSGGFGYVYLAEDPMLQRTVAIKAPRRSAFGSDGDLASFLSEARHAAALDHPGIVPVYDVLADDGGLMLIVMKHVEGTSLASLLHRGALSIEQAVRLVIQASRAVHFAHERGFVHRDLKPANVVIDNQGNAHVLDFGLSLRVHDDSASIRHGGTAPYMSPEQVRHDVLAIDRRTDVWSLGVMLCELVHGQRPFPQRSLAELHRAIQFSEPEIDTTRETPALDDIVRRCLEKSPAKRIQTTSLLATELSVWLDRHHPTGLRKWRYGWRRNVAVATLLLTSMVMYSAIATSSRYKQAELTLRQLESAPTHQIVKLAAELQTNRQSGRALAAYRLPDDVEGRFRLDMAGAVVGHYEAGRAARLISYLESAGVDDVAAACDVLSMSSSLLRDDLVGQITDRYHREPGAIEIKVPLAACLARLAPEHVVWPTISPHVVLALCSLDSADLAKWLEVSGGVGKPHLVEHFTRLMNSREAADLVRLNATRAAADFLRDQPDRMASLVAQAAPDQIPLIVARMEADREHAVSALLAKFAGAHEPHRSTQIEDDAQPSKPEQESANLAVALALLGDFDAAFAAWQAHPDPTLQTLVIHRLAAEKISVGQLLNLLNTVQSNDSEYAAAVKFALLQCIALLPPDTSEARRLASVLNELWQREPDPGVHSSAKAAAGRHGIELADLEPGIHGGWLVERIGSQLQDFTIIAPCSAQLGAFSVADAPLLTTPWPLHERQFPRAFAISTNELTIAQFREFDAAFWAKDEMLKSSPKDAAMMMLNLQAAYRFCNRLSEHCDLQTCYEESDSDQAVLVPKQDHLLLGGYRLPTDAEWELACRAGTHTSRYFGNNHELVERFGWLYENAVHQTKNKNGALQSQRVSQFLPNRWGLFDLYGNAAELCDLSNAPDPNETECIDRLASALPGSADIGVLKRGVSMQYPGRDYARSHCRTMRLLRESVRTDGIRLVRTCAQVD